MQVNGETIVDYEDILRFWNIERERELRTAPKITEHHIRPTNRQKMRVKFATQLLSRSTAAGELKGCFMKKASITLNSNSHTVLTSTAVIKEIKKLIS